MKEYYYFPIVDTSDEDLKENLRYRYNNTTACFFKIPIFAEEEEAEDYVEKCGVKLFDMVQVRRFGKHTIFHIRRDRARGFYPLIFFGDDFIEKCCEAYE